MYAEKQAEIDNRLLKLKIEKYEGTKWDAKLLERLHMIDEKCQMGKRFDDKLID